MGKIISLASNLASIIAISRLLGPGAFGELSYALAFAAIFVPLGEFGLNAIIVGALVKLPFRRDQILGSALVLRLVATSAMVILALMILYLMGAESSSIKLAVTLLLIAEILRSGAIFMYAFEASGRFGIIAATNATIAVVFAAAKIALAFGGAGVTDLALVFSLEQALFGFAYCMLYHLNYNRLGNVRFSPLRALRLSRKSGLLAISGVFAMMNLKLDQVMIGEMLSDQAVGLYAAAVRISEFWYFVPSIIATVAFPHLVRLHSQSRPAYLAMSQSLLDGFLLLSAAAIFAAVIFGEWLVQLVYGLEYKEAASVLLIHIFGGVFVSMRVIASKWIVVEDVLWMSLSTHGLGAAINFALNLFLIPALGIRGAALATVFSYFVSGYAVFFLNHKMRPVAIMMTSSLLMPLRMRKAIRSLSGRDWNDPRSRQAL